MFQRRFSPGQVDKQQAAIPENEWADGVKNLDLDQETLPMERALGIHWNVESDTFQFKIVIKDRPFT